METDTAVETETAIRFLDWPESVALGAAVAVTTRHGGLSEGAHGSLNLALHVGDDPGKVIANRERAAHAFGVELDDLIFAEQVHGAGSAVVGTPERGRGPGPWKMPSPRPTFSSRPLSMRRWPSS